jgi:hypothetical protein
MNTNDFKEIIFNGLSKYETKEAYLNDFASLYVPTQSAEEFLQSLKPKQLTGEDELARLIKRAKQLHQLCEGLTKKNKKEKAKEIGRLLIKVRGLIGYGLWGKWLSENESQLGFKKRQAYNYIDLIEKEEEVQSTAQPLKPNPDKEIQVVQGLRKPTGGGGNYKKPNPSPPERPTMPLTKAQRECIERDAIEQGVSYQDVISKIINQFYNLKEDETTQHCTSND